MDCRRCLICIGAAARREEGGTGYILVAESDLRDFADRLDSALENDPPSLARVWGVVDDLRSLISDEATA